MTWWVRARWKRLLVCIATLVTEPNQNNKSQQSHFNFYVRLLIKMDGLLRNSHLQNFMHDKSFLGEASARGQQRWQKKYVGSACTAWCTPDVALMNDHGYVWSVVWTLVVRLSDGNILLRIFFSLWFIAFMLSLRKYIILCCMYGRLPTILCIWDAG